MHAFNCYTFDVPVPSMLTPRMTISYRTNLQARTRVQIVCYSMILTIIIAHMAISPPMLLVHRIPRSPPIAGLVGRASGALAETSACVMGRPLPPRSAIAKPPIAWLNAMFDCLSNLCSPHSNCAEKRSTVTSRLESSTCFANLANVRPGTWNNATGIFPRIFHLLLHSYSCSMLKPWLDTSSQECSPARLSAPCRRPCQCCLLD